MKDEGIDTVIQDLDNVTTLEEAKSINSDDALLMSMGKKPELRRGKVSQHQPYMLIDVPRLPYSGSFLFPTLISTQSTTSGRYVHTKS